MGFAIGKRQSIQSNASDGDHKYLTSKLVLAKSSTNSPW